MRLPLLSAVLAVVAAALLVPASAAARQKPITGTLSKSGYTVVSVGYDGKVVSTTKRRFKLVPRSKRVTLHLRDRRGKYAGPVVVGERGKRVVLGVTAGARLGRVTVSRGYARAARAINRRFVDARRTAVARRGVPLGNGRNFGLVPARAGSGSAPGADRDRDGVPNLLDIDSDGDRVLDPLDGGDARTSQEQPPPPPGPEGPGPGPDLGPGPQNFNNFSQLFLELHQTVNANASAVTQEQIDAAVSRHLQVIFLQVPPNTELDCGGLVWCSPGGSGAANAEPWRNFPGDPFPGAFDTDGDGLGTMPLTGTGEFRLAPNANTSQIGSGDTMIQRLADGTELPGLLAFVFNTVPAVTAWSDGSGGGGSISYPVAPGAPGTTENPLTVRRDGAGEYLLNYTYWRPQRRAISTAGESGDFIDIGGLEYEVNVPNVPRSPSAEPGSFHSPQCAPAALSTTHPELQVISGHNPDGPMGQLADSAPDRPADPANTLTFTVNLSRCAELRGGSLQPGDRLNVDIAANPSDPSAHDVANQVIWVQMG